MAASVRADSDADPDNRVRFEYLSRAIIPGYPSANKKYAPDVGVLWNNVILG